VLLAGFIGFIGLASVMDVESLRGVAEQMLTQLSPGPSGRILEKAAEHGARGGATAMVLGLGSALTFGTRAMRQVERAGNRMLGVEKDRPFLHRYRVAFGLALSAGLLLVLGGVLLAGGQAVAEGAELKGAVARIWAVARWPLGGLLAGLAIFLTYRIAPRRQLERRLLIWGTVAALTLWVSVTLILSLYFSVSEKATKTYGALVGVVALLLWCAFSSMALNLGLAVVAELEERGSSVKRSAD
jgi:YihY family inner membrane protein